MVGLVFLIFFPEVEDLKRAYVGINGVQINKDQGTDHLWALSLDTLKGCHIKIVRN